MKKIFSSFLILVLTALSSFQACAKWKVDSYGNIKDGRSSVIISNEDTYNCRMNIASTTFSIVGDDGNALSLDNPCIVGIKSNTAGKNEAAAFTSPVSFTFGATSDTDGNLFGITDANWASQMPWFVGVVTDGTNNYFTISRLPMKQTGQVSTAVCQKGDTDCDTEGDVMILTTGLTLANWTGKNITQVGWLYGTYATTGGAWTFSLTDGFTSARAGFGKNYESLVFAFPTLQNGAVAGYIQGGCTTTPVFNSNSYIYGINRNGIVNLRILLAGDGGTDGSGANQIYIATPYPFLQNNNDNYDSPVQYVDPAGENEGFLNMSSLQALSVYRNTSTTARTQLICSTWSNGNRQIKGAIQYQTLTN